MQENISMVIIRFGPYSFQPFTVIIYILQSSAVQTRPTNSPYKLQPASSRRCSPNTKPASASRPRRRSFCSPIFTAWASIIFSSAPTSRKSIAETEIKKAAPCAASHKNPKPGSIQLLPFVQVSCMLFYAFFLFTVNRKKRVSFETRYMDSGGDLIFRAVSSQVPSARRGLTSVFGMGTGGTLLP